MIPAWVQGVIGAAKVPPIRYKQTSVTFVNSASATYDTSGYVSTLTTTNDRFGDSCTVNWPTDKGDTLVLTFTIRRSTATNAATYVRYQNSSIIASVVYNKDSSTIVFGGTFPVTYTTNMLDVKSVVNYATKTTSLYVADSLGGAKRLVNTVPFTNTQTTQSAQMYFSGNSAKLTEIKAYNGEP